MGPSTNPMNSKIIAEKLALRGRLPPHTLEKNSVVERKNHSIVEAVCAMLHDQGLPKFLWAEAANIIVYIKNQCPH